MQAILFCDKMTDCIPMQDCPEALLPFCNVPLLAHLLRYMEKSGFESAVLLAADERVRRMLDGLKLQMPVRFARSLAALRAQSPTLLLRRLCLPDWDMGELYALCGKGAARLFHADGRPAYAELHPTGSALLEPEAAAVLEQSFFRRADNPGDYRTLQQALLAGGTGQRIGEGVRFGKESVIDSMTILGNDCIIGDGAQLEGCVLGDGVQVGAGAMLKNSVICRHVLVDRDAHLENGAVPEGAILPAHARLTQSRRLLVLPEDGICWREPRWNTPETALRAGAAVSVLSGTLAVGYSHPEGKSLAMAAAAGAVSQGARVWQIGQCALSQMLFAGRLTGCGAFLWVSGEQTIRLIPLGKEGAALSGVQTARLQRALESELSARIVTHGSVTDGSGMLPLWEEAVRTLLPETLPEIRVSCANPVLREAAERLFSGGEGEQITLTLSEDGTKAYAFSMDVGMLREEQLLLLAALSVCEMGEPLILPEYFHPAAEAFASGQHARVLRLRASSPAAEALYARQGICMDGVRLFAHVLRVLTQRKLNLRQAAGLLPKLCTVQREIPTELTRQEVESIAKQNPDTSVRIVLPPQGRLVRVRAHADSMETAAELCGLWEKKLKTADHLQGVSSD
ncbi:MAG: hypothetical protein K2I93_06235 [Oscillospiraceae bacterium]|nr:hypothetical protein [Oscillospiraceae bacterium]